MLEVGQTLQQGRYRIKEKLNQGGMGIVYLATDRNLSDRRVAIKENLDIASETQEQFQHEADMLARLSHPNLPRVTDHFIEPSGRQYLVMDYIDGENLRDYARGGPLSEAEVLPWIGQVMDALEFMHNWSDPETGQPSPIIHRDVKPANIKRMRDGRIVLVDFGLAKYHTDAGTQIAARAVTPGYSPTEQYTGGTDVRSDIYALGATLYALLTGQKPLDSPAIAGGRVLPPPRKYNPQITRNTEQVILRAMQVQARRRFQSIQAMRADLYQRRLSPFTRQILAPRRQPTQQPLALLPSDDSVVTSVLEPVRAPTAPSQPALRWPPPNLWTRIVAFAAMLGFVGLVAILLYRGVGGSLLGTMTLFQREQSSEVPPTATFLPSPPTPTLDVAKWSIQPPPDPITGTLWADPNYDITFVYVPAGVFNMGSANGNQDEQPLHLIHIDSFWIMATEVTNAQYSLCVAAEQCGPPVNTMWNQPDYAQYPVTHVSWYQATRYATWVGGRLPSEAEWEKAARGSDSRIYPWGNEWNGLWLNYCDKQCVRSWRDAQLDDGFIQTAPVGSYPQESASPYQVFDLAGNAREWTSSLWRDYPYNPSDGREIWESNDPRVVRGGFWGDRQDDVRAANRFSVQPAYQGEEVGFRIVRAS